jgi:hypothetical protein
VYDDQSGALVRQEPDPAFVPVIAEIFARTINEDAGYAIAQDLNRRGIPSPHEVRAARLGQPVTDPYPWTLEQVLRIVRNPTYTGLRTHNEDGRKPGERAHIVGPAKWAGIVDRDTWELAQLIVERPSRRTARDQTVKHLLSGIALCGICGSPCRVISNRGYPSYACWGGPAKRGTSCVARLQAPVDDHVTESILKRLSAEDASLMFEVSDDRRDAIAEAKVELARLEARLEEFRHAAEDEDRIRAGTALSGDEWARQLRILTPMIEAARARTVARVVPPLIQQGLDAPDKWAWWYGDADDPDDEGLPVADRRAVVQFLVTVTIHKSPFKNGVRGFHPELIEIDWDRRAPA